MTYGDRHQRILRRSSIFKLRSPGWQMVSSQAGKSQVPRLEAINGLLEKGEIFGPALSSESNNLGWAESSGVTAMSAKEAKRILHDLWN